jgi:hypothetical protein
MNKILNFLRGKGNTYLHIIAYFPRNFLFLACNNNINKFYFVYLFSL